ncbi:MAG: glycosyltransferase family 4 protein [Phycisphaerae bacterium]|nr:glycosyltransferase family 4 protein [Phycisphaerae bacterium]
MRITIVIGPFLPMPPAPTGAIEKVWHKLAEAFAANGNEVTVICAAASGGPSTEMLCAVRYLRLKRMKRTGSTRFDLVKDALYSWRARRQLPPADVTVTNCFWLPAFLRIFSYGSRSRRNRIGALNVHAQRFPKNQFGLYRGADRISTVSEAIAAAIREQTPELASIVKVIPNPVDVSVFRPDGRTVRDETARTILFTGRIHPEKGLELLVRAFMIVHRADPRAKLVLVGPTAIEQGGGGATFVQRLVTLAANAPVEFRPNIADPEELATTLRSCDVYCYPSIAYFGEASPVAPLEAMACGAVPVVSDLPQFSGYVRDGETGLVFQREASDAAERLAACLHVILNDPARASALRAAGVMRARELSVERVAAEHLADFAQLVASRREHAA